MIIEHSGDFKVVDPKTKEVRYDSSGCYYNLLSGGLISSNSWNIGKVIVGNTRTVVEGIGSDYWKKHYDEEGVTEGDTTTKDQILDLLKGETFENIKDILEDVFEEVKYKAKY